MIWKANSNCYIDYRSDSGDDYNDYSGNDSSDDNIIAIYYHDDDNTNYNDYKYCNKIQYRGR